MALSTGIPMSEWETAGEQAVLTALQLLEDAADQR